MSHLKLVNQEDINEDLELVKDLRDSVEWEFDLYYNKTDAQRFMEYVEHQQIKKLIKEKRTKNE